MLLSMLLYTTEVQRFVKKDLISYRRFKYLKKKLEYCFFYESDYARICYKNRISTKPNDKSYDNEPNDAIINDEAFVYVSY